MRPFFKLIWGYVEYWRFFTQNSNLVPVLPYVTIQTHFGGFFTFFGPFLASIKPQLKLVRRFVFSEFKNPRTNPEFENVFSLKNWKNVESTFLFSRKLTSHQIDFAACGIYLSFLYHDNIRFCTLNGFCSSEFHLNSYFSSQAFINRYWCRYNSLLLILVIQTSRFREYLTPENFRELVYLPNCSNASITSSKWTIRWEQHSLIWK